MNRPDGAQAPPSNFHAHGESVQISRSSASPGDAGSGRAPSELERSGARSSVHEMIEAADLYLAWAALQVRMSGVEGSQALSRVDAPRAARELGGGSGRGGDGKREVIVTLVL